jgi:quercetin dioxygenase-like cupin family protein
MRWLAGKKATGTDITLGRVVIGPGKQNPRHCHPNCQEVLYLMAGRLEHSLGREKVTMECGDSIVIPPDTYHNAVNTGSVDADMIVAYSSGERGYRPEKGAESE